MRRVLVSKKTAESVTQTDDFPLLQHPIPESVRPLSGILFALWKADLSVPIELYSDQVQHEYFGYLGNHLRRMSEGDDLSD